MTERNEADELVEEQGWRIGDRVKMTVDYAGLLAGSEGTVSWLHPKRAPVLRRADKRDHDYIAYIRVTWDDAPKYSPGDVVFGMDDYGWLQYEDELELVLTPREGEAP